MLLFQRYPRVESGQISLDQWEAHFAPLFKEIRLLGELPLDNAQRKDLARAMRDLIRELGLTKATQRFKEEYPRSFLAYLALSAARNEELGFWDGVAREMGVSYSAAFFNSAHHWGQLFRALLPRFDLEPFSDVEGGHEYLAIIRLHGGIPAYSLPDFFQEILFPALCKPEYAGMDIDKIIEHALDRSTVQHFVDSPVRYFLKYGGETAREFFARALDMARAWEDEGRFLTASELGLPRYVVRTFQQFVEGRLQTRRGKRLRAPRLQLDPYDPEYLFSLELPEEPIDADQTDWLYEWRLIAHTEQEEQFEIGLITVKKRKREGGLVTTRKALFSERLPPGQLRVTFEARESNHAEESEILGRWYFDLTPPAGEPPVLAFRVRSGQPVRQGAALPATELWLLLPAHLEAQAPPRGRIISRAPELGGRWARWKIELWDLKQARALHLLDPDVEQIRVSVPINAPQTAPCFLNENRVEQDVDDEETPLFVGDPPCLWLPRLTEQEPVEELAGWSVCIQALGSVHPSPPDKTLTLDAFSEAIRVEEEGFIFSLAQVLGPRVWGAYAVELRGPQRLRSALCFRIWPDVSLKALAPYYLPGPQGAQPITFYVQTAADDALLASEDEPGVEVEPTPISGEFQIRLDPDVCIAELVLRRDVAGGRQVQIPLHLRAPRLRWTIRLDEEELPWMTGPTDLPAAKLLQSRSAFLILSWEGAAIAPRGRLALLDAETSGDDILQEEIVPGLAITNRTGLNLALFFDAIREFNDRSVLILALDLDEVEGITPIPLLSLRRDMSVTCVLPEWVDDHTLIIHWEATHRLRNRRLRLWSAWRAWEPGQEYAIPDDVQPQFAHDPPGSGTFQIPEPLSFAAYEVAFRTAPSWEPLRAPPFPTEPSFLLEVSEKETRKRLDTLEEHVLAGKISPFLAAFERACILHLRGASHLRNRAIEKAINQLRHGKPETIIAFNGWLQHIGSDLVSKLRTHMYRPKALKRLFNTKVSREVREAYLADFIHTKLINPESARLVLRHSQNSELRAYATQAIIRRIPPDDIEAWVELVEEGVLNKKQALDFLARDPDLAVTRLHVMSSSPTRDALLDAVARETESDLIVRAGVWVRSEAGWGRIERIRQHDEIKEYLILGFRLKFSEENKN